MRSASPLAALAASAVTAFALVATVFLSPEFAMAGDAQGKPAASQPSTGSRSTGGRQPDRAPAPAPSDQSGGTGCACPQSKEKLWHRPKFADLKAELDETDEIAALESLGLALSQVGDGSTYVWHRRHGRLSGIVQPTSSFKDAAGAVCRHVIVMLAAGAETRRTEGIACRLADGRWQLDG